MPRVMLCVFSDLYFFHKLKHSVGSWNGCRKNVFNEEIIQNKSKNTIETVHFEDAKCKLRLATSNGGLDR